MFVYTFKIYYGTWMGFRGFNKTEDYDRNRANDLPPSSPHVTCPGR